MSFIRKYHKLILTSVAVIGLALLPVFLMAILKLDSLNVSVLSIVGASLLIYYLSLNSSSNYPDLGGKQTDKNMDRIEKRSSVDSALTTIQSSSETINYSSQAMAELIVQSESSASNIAIMMDGVSNMAQKNAQLSQESTQHMNLLDQHLNEIYTYTRSLDEVSADTQTSSMKGHDIVQNLLDQSEQTSKVIDSLGQSVRDIADKMKDMNKITEAILSISNKTQLLALNAAIESARAGEYGRGFAVVANEIGSLADQSKVSSSEIRTMINGISSKMVNTLDLIEEVEVTLEEQMTSVASTLGAFGDIGESINQIGGGIDTIGDLVIQVREAKDELSKILKQVARSSKLTSSTTQQVTASNQEQTMAFTRVQELCSELKTLSQDMMQSSFICEDEVAA